MKNINRFWIFPSLVMGLLFILISSCKKDDNPPEPPHGDPGTVLATATIGTAGGTVSTNDISVKIPAGAFSENREIKIIVYTTTVFGAEQAGSTYKITGFPEPMTASFYLAIRHSGELSGNNYLALGSGRYIKSLNDTATDFCLQQVTDSAGFFATIVNPGSKKDGSPKNMFIDINDHEMVVIPVTRYCEASTSASHFKIEYPCSVPSIHIVALAKALEDAFNIYHEFGFIYDIPTSKPMKVIVRSFTANLFLGYFGNDPDIYGLYERSGYFSTPNDGQILINTDKVADESTMRETAGHEFFHYVQDNYNTGGELKNWITEATAPWAEELFSTDVNYVPDVTLHHYFRPFLGMQAGVGWVDVNLNNTKNSSFHGYGMAALVKYFVDNSGLVDKRQVVYNMIMAIHQDKHPVEAFMNSVEPTANGKILWQSFFKHYILNEVYHSSTTGANMFLTGEFYDITNHAYRHTLTDPDISFITYSSLFPDLSAKLFKFDLSRTFETNDKLIFTTTTGGLAGDVKTSVFKFKTRANFSTIEWLSDGSGNDNETTINDIKTLKDNGYGILVLVTNSRYEAPYTGETEITLELEISNTGLPTLTTNPVTNITLTSAISGGHITKQGYGPVLVRGLCWFTSPHPTILTNHSIDGADTGSYTTSMTGLIPMTTYYVRAYATNSIGTAYGNECCFLTTDFANCGTVTDVDGNIYNTVIIGTQCWMRENLKTSRYRDGGNITNITDDSWTSLTTGIWCNYNNDAGNNVDYGKLYNWYAVNNSNGLCPTGWHVPTNVEWTTLTDSLSGTSVAGGKLKETGITHWQSPNQAATNESGFTALPGGARYDAFSSIGTRGSWWSSTEYNPNNAWYQLLSCDDGISYILYYDKSSGYSVRCLKD